MQYFVTSYQLLYVDVFMISAEQFFSSLLDVFPRAF